MLPICISISVASEEVNECLNGLKWSTVFVFRLWYVVYQILILNLQYFFHIRVALYFALVVANSLTAKRTPQSLVLFWIFQLLFEHSLQSAYYMSIYYKHTCITDDSALLYSSGCNDVNLHLRNTWHCHVLPSSSADDWCFIGASAKDRADLM